MRGVCAWPPLLRPKLTDDFERPRLLLPFIFLPFSFSFRKLLLVFVLRARAGFAEIRRHRPLVFLSFGNNQTKRRNNHLQPFFFKKKPRFPSLGYDFAPLAISSRRFVPRPFRSQGLVAAATPPRASENPKSNRGGASIFIL